jgi:dipeptidyl aminopeptidase/acylaminoacyl peptidase
MHAPRAYFARFRSWPQASFIGLAALLLASGVAPRAANAQPDTTRWTPRLSMQYDQIPETEISPDGEQVAYVVRKAVMDETTSEFRQHVHVASVDGSSDVQFTYGEHSNFSPRWSPSGDRLAFLSTRGDGPPQVYLMRTGGGEAYAVTGSRTGVNSFQWGPEGERIAYTATDPKSKAEKRREKEKRDVTEVNEEFRYAHLYVTEVKPASDTTRTVQRLTEGDFHVTGFDWAPGGNSIAFAHKPNPRFNSIMGTDISAVPADSGATEVLVERPGVDADPRYSPSGERIAFESMGGREAWEGLFDIWTVPAGGGTPTALAQTPDRYAGGYLGSGIVGWTAGEESVLVVERTRTSAHVYAVPADGGPAGQVSFGDGVYGAVSHSRSADRLAFAYENSESAPEVYVSARQNFSRRRITAVNADVPTPEMGRTDLVSWTAPDGTRVEGLLTYPVGYDGGRVPLILSVHGGPSWVHSRSFTGGTGELDYFPGIQASAQRGYAVLRPNPRGSSGYGHSFRTAAFENWGPGPFRDLMAGVDKAIDIGVAHPDSLAIMGWSYGGYMTAYAVTQTDRFGAASMGRVSQILLAMSALPTFPAGKWPRWAGRFGRGSRPTRKTPRSIT